MDREVCVWRSGWLQRLVGREVGEWRGGKTDNGWRSINENKRLVSNLKTFKVNLK